MSTVGLQWERLKDINVNLLSLLPVKPVAVHILTKDRFVSADRTYDIECKSSGSKPAALISWWKANKQLKKQTKNVSFLIIQITLP